MLPHELLFYYVFCRELVSRFHSFHTRTSTRLPMFNLMGISQNFNRFLLSPNTSLMHFEVPRIFSGKFEVIRFFLFVDHENNWWSDEKSSNRHP